MHLIKICFLCVFFVLTVSTTCTPRPSLLDSVDTENYMVSFHVIDDGLDPFPGIVRRLQVVAQVETYDKEIEKVTDVNLWEDELWFSTEPNFYMQDLSGDVYSDLERYAETHSRLEYLSGTLPSFLSAYMDIDRDHYRGSARVKNFGGAYYFSMIREDKTDALNSFVYMPRRFDIHQPEQGASYSRSSDAINISWAPTQGVAGVTIEIASRCSQELAVYVVYRQSLESDPGAHTINGNRLTDLGLVGECTSEVSIVRTREGELDSVYAGGRIAAHQIRSVKIVTMD